MKSALLIVALLLAGCAASDLKAPCAGPCDQRIPINAA